MPPHQSPAVTASPKGGSHNAVYPLCCIARMAARGGIYAAPTEYPKKDFLNKIKMRSDFPTAFLRYGYMVLRNVFFVSKTAAMHAPHSAAGSASQISASALGICAKTHASGSAKTIKRSSEINRE
mgnify:CR=1 FL=1